MESSVSGCSNRRNSRAWLAVVVCLALIGCVSNPVEPEPDTQSRRMGNLVLFDVPEVPTETISRLRQYQNTRSAGLRGWMGESVLIATRFGDTTQLHQVHAPMGVRQQLTFFDEPVSQAYLSSRNDAGFVYARDVGGSEFYQLFWFDRASGEHRLLTDGKSRYGGVLWNTAGDGIAYYTTERNGRSRDLHVRYLPGGLPGSIVVALEEDEGAWFPEDFSPDDQRMLVSRYVSINESYLFELDLASGTRRALLDDGLKAAIGQAQFDGPGTGVYFTSDMGAEFMRLHHLDLASGRIEVLTADIPWNVEGFTLSDDGSRLAFSVNENGSSRVVVWRLPEHHPIALPELPAGVLSRLFFSADASQLALSLSTPMGPTDVWSLSFDDRRLVRWTSSEVGGLQQSTFVAPELIEYETFDAPDGRIGGIPAFLFRPHSAGPHPVLILIHGGPEGQYRPRFSATVQYLVGELGIAVIAPNVRGSAGYGKSYLKLDNGKLREDSVKDIGALLDWIGAREDLDPARVAVMGGSYGGYMVLAALVHYSDRLAAGVESVGISNFVTFLENTQPYRQDLRRAEYGDERDAGMRAYLEAISPLNRVDKITRPLMISQGANDPRVPASESEQIYQALKSSGTPVWYVLAEDEGHGFRKKRNRDFNAAVMTLFLQEYLLP